MRPIALLFVCASILPAAENHLWVTWDSFEPDACASMWLIKRHVDSSVRFEILPKGSPITHGIAFDTPDAKLRRYAMLATYEAILNEYKIKDKPAIEIGKLIHDIEINKWTRSATAPSRDLEQAVLQIVGSGKTSSEILPKVFSYFDALAANAQSAEQNRRK